MKKKAFGASMICIIIVLVGGYLGLKKYETEKLKAHMLEITNHYHNYMKAIKDTPLLKQENDAWIPVGTIYQDSEVELEDILGEYYQIKSTQYYIHYQDFISINEKKIYPTNSYLLFKEDVITKNPTILYQNNQKKYELNLSIQAPILKKENDTYTVFIHQQAYQIKKDQIDREVSSDRKVEEQTEKISVLYFQGNPKEEYLKYLEQEEYTFLKEDELIDFWNGVVRLPKKSIMLVFEEETDATKKLIQKYNLTVQYKQDLKQTYQNGDSQISKGSFLAWYLIDSKTTISRLKDILAGKKEISFSPTQKIAVLNYHFFYDKNTESCNESICLEKNNFAQQLNYLKENNFRTLTMQELNDWLDKKIELPEKSVLITVDDGAMGTDSHLSNLLAQYDAKATLFLISGWWPVSKYTTGNLEIQSHGHELHHNNYCKDGKCGIKGLLLSSDELQSDLQLSKQTIGNPIAFCYPFYAYNDTLVNAVKKEFSLAFIGGNRKASRTVDKYKIPRYVIYKNTSLESFKKMVNP